MADKLLRAVDGEARALAKRLLRTASRAALASLEPQTGWPYSSLVTVATTLDGALLMLLSGLSAHTKALADDPRCSLLLADVGQGDPLAHPRLTVFARAEFLSRDREGHQQVRQRFLSRHPRAALYADFGDFGFVRVQPERASLNAGFGRASEMSPNDFMTPITAELQPLLLTEASAVAHMNQDHADAVKLIASHLCGGVDGAWQLIGLDPEGLDLGLDGRYLRYAYEEPLTSADQLRGRLVDLTRQARACLTGPPGDDQSVA